MKFLAHFNDKEYDTLGPITGYRSWDLTRNFKRLKSVTRLFTWDNPPSKALCVNRGGVTGTALHPSETSPAKFCNCGFFSFKDHDWDKIAPYGYFPVASIPIIGEVKAWGKVWTHQLGYRSEFAKPTKIYRTWPGGYLEDKMLDIATYYGLEIVDPPDSLVKYGQGEGWVLAKDRFIPTNYYPFTQKNNPLQPLQFSTWGSWPSVPISNQLPVPASTQQSTTSYSTTSTTPFMEVVSIKKAKKINDKSIEIILDVMGKEFRMVVPLE